MFFDQTIPGLGMGKLFLGRESLVSDIPAGAGNIAKPFLQCSQPLSCKFTHVEYMQKCSCIAQSHA